MKRPRVANPAEERNLGKLGEATLESWAAQVGIVSNRANEDKAGWDFLLQFPLPKHTEKLTALDDIPFDVSCLCQVKATDSAKSVPVKLSNWQRMVKNPLAAFFLVLDFRTKNEPQRAFLIHVGEQQISKLLSRLRATPNSQSDKLNKMSINLTWTEDDRLEALNGEALRATILKHVGKDPGRYSTNKICLVNSVGFESSSKYQIRVKVFPRQGAAASALMADFAIGKLSELPATLVTVDEMRFGIPKPKIPDLPKVVLLSVPALHPVARMDIEFSSGSRTAQFEADYFASQSMFPFLEKEYQRHRLVADEFEIIFSAGSADAIVNIYSGEQSSDFSLKRLANWAEFVFLFEDAAKRSGSVSLSMATRNGGKYSLQMKATNQKLDRLILMARVARDASEVAEYFKLPPTILTSWDQLLKHSESLATLRNVFFSNARDTNRLQFEANTEIPNDLHCAISMVVAAPIRDVLMVLVAAVHGVPTRWEETRAGRKRISVDQPAIEVVKVETVRLKAGQQKVSFVQSHRDAQLWIEQKGYEYLDPLSGNGPTKEQP